MLPDVVVGEEEGVSLFCLCFLLPYCLDSEKHQGMVLNTGPGLGRGFAVGFAVFGASAGVLERAGTRKAGRAKI